MWGHVCHVVSPVTGVQIDCLKCAIHLQRKQMLHGKPKDEVLCSCQPQSDVTVCISWGCNPKYFWDVSLFPVLWAEGRNKGVEDEGENWRKIYLLLQTNWERIYIFWLLCHFSCHVLITNASQIQKFEINWPSELLRANTRGRAGMIRAGLIRGHKTQQTPGSPHVPCKRTEIKQIPI